VTDEGDVEGRDLLQHFVRADRVERGEPWEQRDGDALVLCVIRNEYVALPILDAVGPGWLIAGRSLTAGRAWWLPEDGRGSSALMHRACL
jgi:hypothetical protein